MMDIVVWLRSLGLEKYEAAFRENEIDEKVLPKLTAEDLKDLGVSIIGHRRKLLDAIAALQNKTSAADGLAEGRTIFTEHLAERRQVTVMFSDLVGSADLSARMDPEDFGEVVSAYHHCIAETVQRFGGFVAAYTGDGVIVYLGYPKAHEDDAEQAIRAGLEMVVAVRKLKTHATLQTRVGIATGLVVIGDLFGSGASGEQSILGETPNLAARLLGIAEPSSVVIAESTRKLVGNLFELHDLGAHELKGIAGPARASAVLRPSLVESRFEALRAVTTPLVGRSEEIELLMRRWEQAKDGDGCVVLISGEPGIGKSRVAQTIVERLANEPHIRLRYFCSSHHQDSALYPSISQLERAGGFRREDTDKERLSKLETVLAQATSDLGEVVPLMAGLLSIPTGHRYPPLNLSPQQRKERIFQAQLAQLEGLASRQPVLMVFEDVHWSDPTTLESLDLLIDRLPTLRVLVILTFRPEFAPPWIGRPQVTLISLNRLSPRQRAKMIAHVTGGKTLPKEISDQIVERTDGVPLFVEELTKSVDSLPGIFLSGLQRAVRILGPAVLVIEHVGEAQADIGPGIVRIVFQCLPEVLDRLSERFEVVFLPEHEFAAAQHTVVGDDVGCLECLSIGKPFFLGRTKSDLERVNDPVGNVVLHLKDIYQIAVVPVRPQVAATGRIDELRCDTNALGRPANRAFEHRLHAKLAADGADVDRASLIGKAGIAGDHHETRDLRQIGDNVIADAIREILLFRVARHLVNGRTAIDAVTTLGEGLSILDWVAPGVARGCHFQIRIGRLIFLTVVSPASWKWTSIRLPMLSLTIEETQMPPGSANGSSRAAMFTPPSMITSPRLIPIRNTIFGWRTISSDRLSAERCTEMAQFTASITLPNSTMAPSPISLTIRPLWAATAGSKIVCRCRLRAVSVPASSAPISREYPTTSAARIAASLRLTRSWAMDAHSVSH